MVPPPRVVKKYLIRLYQEDGSGDWLEPLHIQFSSETQFERLNTSTGVDVKFMTAIENWVVASFDEIGWQHEIERVDNVHDSASVAVDLDVSDL